MKFDADLVKGLELWIAQCSAKSEKSLPVSVFSHIVKRKYALLTDDKISA